MAVPASFTILDLSGKFVMNKSLSDDPDPILAGQGMSWVTRKIIKVATVTLAIKHDKNEEGVERIVIDQTLTGGIPGSKEERTLSWTERHTSDPLFGAVVGRSKRCQVSELEEEFLKKNWTADTVEHGVVLSWVESDTPVSKKTWSASQTWGIQEIEGQRRHARNIKFTTSGKDIEATLVYDYVGPL
ncbi:hypothetical protein K438DRAFT_1706868 [Mycena galopus ATCC 62051]|nr:hypothetical protein K438DRAFT_1706868 [Mycena galopus ATCC 62051]